MIQLNLKPDKLLPSVFTSQLVIEHDTLKADIATLILPLVFIVSILVRVVSWLYCTSVFLLWMCIQDARGYLFKQEVLSLDGES